MIQLAMTPEQFAAATAVIESSPEVLSHSESGLASGAFATSKVEMRYSYNGVDTLTLNVTAKHGIAKFASEGTIKAHLVALLAKV